MAKLFRMIMFATYILPYGSGIADSTRAISNHSERVNQERVNQDLWTTVSRRDGGPERCRGIVHERGRVRTVRLSA